MTIQEIKQLAAQFLIGYPGSAVGKVLAIDSAGTGLEWVTSGGGSSNAAPTASGVSITGTYQVGQIITGHYTYADSESEPEGSTLLKWYRADDDTGTNLTVISGVTSITYTLQNADLGKIIKFGVTPKAQFGTMVGTEVFSSYTTVIGANIIANVWIIAGQSNAQGEAAPYDLFAPYTNADVLDTEKVWNNGSSIFEKLAVSSFGTSNNGGSTAAGINKVGPEMSMMRKLAETSGGENVYLVKYAVGATPLYDTGNTNTWFPTTSGGLLGQLLTRVLAAKAYLEGQGKIVVFKGMLWAQGESDSWAGESTVNYQTNLEALYTKVNTQLGTTNLPFVVYQIHINGSGANTTQKGYIRTAQANFVAASPTTRFLVNVDQFKLRDPYHIDTDGQAFLGEEAATFLPFSGTYVAPTFTSHGAAAPAPTNSLVDAINHTFGFTEATGYATNLHEYSINGGGTWQAVTSNPFTVPARDISVGLILVRVAQGASNDPSPIIYNDIPYVKDNTTIQFDRQYVNEVADNSYYGVPFTVDYGLTIPSVTGGGVKFQFTDDFSFKEIALIGAFSNNATQYTFTGDGTNVVLKNSAGTTIYSEAKGTINSWYRFKQQPWANTTKLEKSANGTTGWTTMFSFSSIGNYGTRIESPGATLYTNVLIDRSIEDTSLLAYWGFNEGDGASYYTDLSGKFKSLALMGSGGGFYRGIGGGYGSVLNASVFIYSNGQYLQTQSYDNLSADATNGFTFAGWIAFESGALTGNIIKKIGEYYITLDGAGNINWETYAAPGNTGLVGVSRPLGDTSVGVFHFICASWSPANGMSLQVDNGTAATAAQSTMAVNQASPVQISGLSGERFYGLLDQFRLFNRELTPTEKTFLFNEVA